MLNEIKPSFGVSARIWWSITWKTMLVGLFFSFFIGLFVTMVTLVATGGNDNIADISGRICSILATIPITILVIQSCLNANYGKYRVSLTELKETDDVIKTEPTIS